MKTKITVNLTKMSDIPGGESYCTMPLLTPQQPFVGWTFQDV